MADVFLSYAREDATVAKRLADHLEKSGFSVWWDHNLAGGERYLEITERELAAAKAVVVVWSHASLASHWVADEAGAGRDTGRLIPLSIDGSLPPLGFRQFQVIDFSRWSSAHEGPFGELKSALQRLVAATTSSEGQTPRVLQKRRRIVGPALMAAVLIVGAALIGLVMVGGGGRAEKKRATPQVASIAVQLFDAQTGDAAAAGVAQAISAAISDRLTAAGLPVVASAPSRSGADAAAGFDVTGSVVRDGKIARVVARVVHNKRGLTLWSSTFEGPADEVGALADQISVQVASAISWSGAVRALDSDAPNAAEFAAGYLLVVQRGKDGDGLGAAQAARRLVEKSPDIAQAHVALAIETARARSAMAPEARKAAMTEAHQSAERALELDPHESDAYVAVWWTTPQWRWADQLNVLQRGLAADPEGSSLGSFLTAFYLSTGELALAVGAIERARALDRFADEKASWLALAYLYSGRNKEAETLLTETERVWPNSRSVATARFETALWSGTPAAVEAFLAAHPSAELSGLAKALRTRQTRDVEGVEAACREASDAQTGVLGTCLRALTILGRLDAAFAIADKLYPALIGVPPGVAERLWLDQKVGDTSILFAPWMAPLRQDARLVPVFRRLGLIDYWRAGHRPDFCAAGSSPVCEAI